MLPGFAYEGKAIDKDIIRGLCEWSLILGDLEGILLKEFILIRELKSHPNNLVDEDDITFLNTVFEECKESLREWFYHVDNSHSDENMSRVRILDSLFLENAYDELYEKLLIGKIKTDFYIEYGLEEKKNVDYFFYKEVYYNLYKLFSEDTQMNVK